MVAVGGVYTLRYRQSSSVLGMFPTRPGGWGQELRNCCVSSTPDHGVTGAGGANRRLPSGGAAKGIPRNSSWSLKELPCTTPFRVRTVGWPSIWALAARGRLPDRARSPRNQSAADQDGAGRVP